jgi:hypothetical protein
MGRIVILKVPEWMYKLTQDEEGILHLEVVCGGIFEYMVDVILNDYEIDRYQSQGRDFLDNMAYDVCKNRQKYKGRIVRDEGPKQE